jgi:hypothetical protein
MFRHEFEVTTLNRHGGSQPRRRPLHSRVKQSLFAILSCAALNLVTPAVARGPVAPMQTDQTITTVTGSVSGKKTPSSSNQSRTLHYAISSLDGDAAFATLDANGTLQTTKGNVQLTSGFAYVKITGGAGAISMRPEAPSSPTASHGRSGQRMARLGASTPTADVGAFMSQIYLPFILGNRTIGGAEGTEVVVYVRDIDANQAEVFYFYLHTEESTRTVDISAFWLDGSVAPAREVMLGQPFTLGVGTYARLPMRRVNHDGAWKWFLTDKAAITRHPIDGSLAPGLKSVLNAAHRAACVKKIAGTGPSEVTFGAKNTLTLKCGDIR